MSRALLGIWVGTCSFRTTIFLTVTWIKHWGRMGGWSTNGDMEDDGQGSVLTEAVCPRNSDARFLRGDCNDDGTVDISDAIFSLRSLFLREGASGEATSTRLPPGCDDACDSNDDGAVDISDAIGTVFVLFVGGVVPLPGMTTCGVDPTDDGLGCAETACP